ncbi:hypothetical protein Gotur_007918, partial [Gossypium turneri]
LVFILLIHPTCKSLQISPPLIFGHSITPWPIWKPTFLESAALFNGIGEADLVFGMVIHMLALMEEVVGYKFIKADSFPRLHAWVKHFSEHPAIKDKIPVLH